MRLIDKYQMTEFRPCKSYPGYSASIEGEVRRDKPRSDGSPWILTVSKNGLVVLCGKAVSVANVVADAWGHEAIKHANGVEFRPCVSHPGYSASLCGQVLRDKPRSDGTHWILKITEQNAVVFDKKAVPVDRVVADAWGDFAPPVTSKLRTRHAKINGEYRPKSSYPDGVVKTLQEYCLELSRRRLDP